MKKPSTPGLVALLKRYGIEPTGDKKSDMALIVKHNIMREPPPKLVKPDND